MFDLGMAAKTRPVLVVSTEYSDTDHALITVVPHTTELRGSPLEIAVKCSFLRPGAFLVQSVSSYSNAWAFAKSTNCIHCKWQPTGGDLMQRRRAE